MPGDAGGPFSIQMRDRSVYTKEGCEAIIRHLRMYREILSDEEARILMLYQACQQLKEPVDAFGRRASLANKREKDKFKVPAGTPFYLGQALRAGEPQVLPGYQD